MLSAKLFAGLTGLILVVMALNRLRVFPSSVLGFSAGRIGFGPFYWQIFAVAMASVSALAYFVVFRFVVIERPPNQFAGLVGFFLIAAAALIWLSAAYMVGSHWPSNHAQVITLLAAILSFVAGTLVTTANLAWVLLKTN
jgi:hypothetical protein